jgi:hypothetical protein
MNNLHVVRENLGLLALACQFNVTVLPDSAVYSF